MVGHIEPIGVREDVRSRGLAWCILAEEVRRLRACGATQILVQTDNYRDRAYTFYQTAGFQIVENITMYRKDFGSGTEE
jgi:ribosomal protein S18 acetylase RimI-like enzyme